MQDQLYVVQRSHALMLKKERVHQESFWILYEKISQKHIKDYNIQQNKILEVYIKRMLNWLDVYSS